MGVHRSVELHVVAQGDGLIDWWITSEEPDGQMQLWSAQASVRLRLGESVNGLWGELYAELWAAAVESRLLAGLLEW